jgi:hypothetical protein
LRRRCAWNAASTPHVKPQAHRNGTRSSRAKRSLRTQTQENTK